MMSKRKYNRYTLNKRECTNETSKKQIASAKNKHDTCKSKVEKTEIESGKLKTSSNQHTTKLLSIAENPLDNITCQQIWEPIMVNHNSFHSVKHICVNIKYQITWVWIENK